MKVVSDPAWQIDPDRLQARAADGLVHDIAAAIPAIQQRAAIAPDAFPQEGLGVLRDAGALLAVLPRQLGGLGVGTEPDAATDCASLLATIGEASLSLGRVYEAHVNAVRLLVRYGDPALHQRLSRRLRTGALFALWVTDPHDAAGLCAAPANGALHLSGGKAFCSAAGYATDTVVIATLDAAPRLLWLGLNAGERIAPAAVGLTGMRASATGAVDFTGVTVRTDAVFGAADDYMREPDFSAGAWRGSAVAWGGLRALVTAMREQLLARGRDRDTHQRVRFGSLLIAAETARHFVLEAARRGEAGDDDPPATIAYVNLARIAVERACLDGMELVQRALGLQAFVATNRVSHVCRDLAVYLRQPAPDEVLVNAGEHGLSHAAFP